MGLGHQLEEMLIIRQRFIAVTAVLAMTFLLTHCAAFSPDRYQGNGSWIRHDGTEYSGAPPIAVTGVEVLRSSINRDRYIENVASQNAEGQTVIREVVTTNVEVDADLVVHLEDGSVHVVVVHMEGPENATRVMSVSFTAPNAKTYRVVNTFTLNERRPSISVRVSAPGPITYRTTLYVE